MRSSVPWPSSRPDSEAPAGYAVPLTAPASVIEDPEIRRIDPALDHLAGMDAALAMRLRQRDQLAALDIQRDLECRAEEQHVAHLRREPQHMQQLAVGCGNGDV